MKGYQRGVTIIVDEKPVHLNEEQIKIVTQFGNECSIQNKIIDELYPNTFDDDISFMLAASVNYVMTTQNISFEEALKHCLDDGFFPDKNAHPVYPDS